MRTDHTTARRPPANGTDQRELVAILFTDMVGFAAIRQALALELRAEMLTLAREALSRDRGRLVNTMGDAFLAKFPTADEAVRFSFLLQEAVCQRNAGQPRHRRFRLRLGMHLGEVVVQPDGNILGENVNIAARAEKLARPGGLCVTEYFWRQLDDDIQRRFDRLGNIPVRHIRQRVCFYHWPGEEAGWSTRIHHRTRVRFARLGRQVLLGLTGVVLVLAALALWSQARSRTPDTPDAQIAKGTKLLEHYYRPGNLTNACALFQSALDKRPKSYRANAGLAWAHWLRYRETTEPPTLVDAKTQATNALELNQEFGLPHRVLGMAAFREGRLLEASNQLFAANNDTSWINGYDLASLAEVELHLGLTNRARMRWEAAQRSAAEAKDWMAWSAVGGYAFRQRNLAGAASAYQSALQLDRKNPLVLGDLAIVRWHLGQTNEAFELAQQSLDRLRSAATLANLATILLSRAPPLAATRSSSSLEHEKVAQYYREAVRQCPGNYVFRLRAANFLIGLPNYQVEARQQYELAEKQIGAVLLDPTHQSLLLVHRGWCHAGLGRTNEAKDDFLQAETQGTNRPPLMEALAQGYRLLRDKSEETRILTLLNQAKSNNPSPPP